MIKVGLGKDMHRLVTGRPFLLGGVDIPFEKGESGHSDGDVLIHAVIDALLGASGLGDIGELFPAETVMEQQSNGISEIVPKWKDADSRVLLSIAWKMIQKQGWRIVNLDCVVSCENPKILPYREKIRESLAQVLSVNFETIFIKGKTGEGLGHVGKGEAVEALAVCLLERD